MAQNRPKPYGIELVLDLHGCNLEHVAKDLRHFAKNNLEKFFTEICRITRMKRHGKPMWWIDDSGTPHLHGISAVQFVETSDIVCHVLPVLGAVYLNIFTCKQFRPEAVVKFCKKYWRAKSVATQKVIIRK
ncbi:MAG: S-adenosylmethionine decarboxylase [Candidatus Sungiibacteriota bacterium]